MSEALAIAAAVITAILAIVAIVRISVRRTSRRSLDDLKRERPDASNIHQDSGIAS